jgi:hypothetical protein
MTLKQITALPTWLVVLACCKSGILPEGHPFKKSMISLDKWERRRTDVCKFFDFALFITTAGMMFATIQMM